MSVMVQRYGKNGHYRANQGNYVVMLICHTKVTLMRINANFSEKSPKYHDISNARRYFVHNNANIRKPDIEGKSKPPVSWPAVCFSLFRIRRLRLVCPFPRYRVVLAEAGDTATGVVVVTAIMQLLETKPCIKGDLVHAGS